MSSVTNLSANPVSCNLTSTQWMQHLPSIPVSHNLTSITTQWMQYLPIMPVFQRAVDLFSNIYHFQILPGTSAEGRIAKISLLPLQKTKFDCASFDRTQISNNILMVSPDQFTFNAQSSKTNSFQNQVPKNINLQKQVMSEFQEMKQQLFDAGANVIHLTSPILKKITVPDAVFPNNWFSTHVTKSGKNILVLYPMLTENRRAERQPQKLQQIFQANGITIDEIVDLTSYEAQNKALEGTGSLVLDRQQQLAFASLSPRTDVDILSDFAQKVGFKPVIFHSYDRRGKLIYHTNVMMSVGEQFAVICSESITDETERREVLTKLEDSGKHIIHISYKQMENMCANILQIDTNKNGPLIVMSKTAFKNFTPQQLALFRKYGEVMPVDIAQIEHVGGGSARCMIAELFLCRNKDNHLEL